METSACSVEFSLLGPGDEDFMRGISRFMGNNTVSSTVLTELNKLRRNSDLRQLLKLAFEPREQMIFCSRIPSVVPSVFDVMRFFSWLFWLVPPDCKRNR